MGDCSSSWDGLCGFELTFVFFKHMQSILPENNKDIKQKKVTVSNQMFFWKDKINHH